MSSPAHPEAAAATAAKPTDAAAGAKPAAATTTTTSTEVGAKREYVNELIWNPKRLTWMERYNQLKLFKQKYGHTCVPTNKAPYTSLGRWVCSQRTWYERHTYEDGDLIKYDTTHRERIDLMNEIAFHWYLKESKRSVLENDTWMKHYKHYKKFIEQHGREKSSQIRKNSVALAHWVHTQKAWFQKHTNDCGELIKFDEFDQERIDKLNEIGFVWDIHQVSNNDKWKLRYNELKEYKQQNGHCNVPQLWKPNKSLGIWVTSQRVWYKKKN